MSMMILGPTKEKFPPRGGTFFVRVETSRQQKTRAFSGRMPEGVVVGLVLTCADLSDKLKHLTLDIGDQEVTIVTNAPNVGTRTIGKKVVVAKVGVEVEGETITKRSVGGVASEGMLMDSKMMGWSGGAAGNCILLPDSSKPGDLAPSSRPMGGDVAVSQETPGSSVAADKKKAKEDAKAAAKAAREAKKAAKEAAKEFGADKAAEDAP